jgi:hypothetical protein
MQLSSKGENAGFAMLLPRWSTFSTILGCDLIDMTGTSAVTGGAIGEERRKQWSSSTTT